MDPSPDKANEHIRRMVRWLNGCKQSARERKIREQIEPVIAWLNAVTHGNMRRPMRHNFNLALLSSCRVFPQLDPITPGAQPTVSWLPGLHPPQSAWLCEVLYALDHGWLSRLRRCAYERCRLWFDAKDPRKKFHSAACKKASYNASPKGRKSRRLYMRRYYRDNFQKRED